MVELTTKAMQELKDQGWSYQAIADKVGLTRQAVYYKLNYVGKDKYNAKRRKYYRRRKDQFNQEDK